jgi:hypothetical protein
MAALISVATVHGQWMVYLLANLSAIFPITGSLK